MLVFCTRQCKEDYYFIQKTTLTQQISQSSEDSGGLFEEIVKDDSADTPYLAPLELEKVILTIQFCQTLFSDFFLFSKDSLNLK